MKLSRIFLAVWFMIPVHGIPEKDTHLYRIGPAREVMAGVINVGLLIPDNQSLSARQGAEMAVRSANERGGIGGMELRLVVRSMEGPWGTGSKEAVNLIFDEHVWAILGSHDGRNAHLVEQVAAKERILFLSAWTSDPTLSQAFVPWYFSCVPNDIQQADALINEIYVKRKLRNISVVLDSSYDSNMMLKNFIKQVISNKRSAPDPIYYHNDKNSLTGHLHHTRAEAVILLEPPAVSLKIIGLMRQEKMQLPVFCSLSSSCEQDSFITGLSRYENVVLISSGQWFFDKGLAFRQEFLKEYGYWPDAVSVYAYDGMNLIIEAIKRTGLDRNKMQSSMAKTVLDGASGKIGFDMHGNRLGSVLIMEIKDRHPILIR